MRFRELYIVIVAPLLLLVAIAAASEPGETSIAPSWQDQVSRDPVWLISAFSGNRDAGNPLGYASWWNGPNAVEELLGRIGVGYELGARRFFINRPMGTDGASHVSGGSWLTIERMKRGELVDALAETLLDRYEDPVELIWFVGSDLRDPRDIRGWHSFASDEYFQIGDNSTPKRLYASRMTLGGWISTGAGGIAIDHSSGPDERDHFINLARSLRRDPFQVTLYGEAIPSERSGDDDGSMRIDLEALHAMPWIATEDYLASRWPDRSGPLSLQVDRRLSRVFKWFNRSAGTRNDAEALDAAQLAIRNGLIPITNDPRIFSAALDIQNRIDQAREPEQENQAQLNPQPEERNGIRPSATPSVAIWGEENEPSMLGSDIPPVTVERPTGGKIVVTGVTYARIEPSAPVSRGVPIALGYMGWSDAPNGVVAFDVETGEEYTVHTAVFQYLDDGGVDYSIGGDYTTVFVPQDRQHQIQYWLELAIEIGQVEQQLGGRDSITWPEINEALAAIRQEEQDDAAAAAPGPEAPARD